MDIIDYEKVVIDRIISFINTKNESYMTFAKKVNIPRSTLSSFLSKKILPSARVLVKITIAYPELSTEWLLRGKGSMYLSNENNKEENQAKQEDEKDNKLLEIIMEQAKQIGRLEALLEEKEKEVKKIAWDVENSKGAHVG